MNNRQLPHVIGLQCLRCGTVYSVEDVQYICPRHEEHDVGNLDVLYDYGVIRERTNPARIAQDPDPSIGRYAALLPVLDRAWLPPIPVGGTPMYLARRLGERLGVPALYVKDDGRNPSASFKDRASAVGLAHARVTGHRTIVAASTGNAAASLALLSAATAVRPIIFVPESAPPAKMAQLLIHGATVVAVQGSYDDAYTLSLEATRRFGWYSRNTGFNPYLSEGKKSAAFEICEQFTAMSRLDLPALLGHRGDWVRSRDDRWEAPDAILVAVGDGCIIGGLGKGLLDLQALGWLDKVPRLIGVQAEGSAAIYNAWRSGGNRIHPVTPSTLADSISVSKPRDPYRALRAVRATDGAMVLVSDEEILEAMRLLAQEAAVFAEPAAAAALAGLRKALEEGHLTRHERVVVLITGNGLKDVAAALRAVGEPIRVPPTPEALEQLAARLPEGMVDHPKG